MARGINDPQFNTTRVRQIIGDGSLQIVWFGLQAILRKYLAMSITVEDVIEANDVLTAHGEPFNYDGWMYIAEKYGYIPVTIKALPEGTKCDVKTVLATVESEDPNVAWVVPWVEDILLRAWYPTTVATLSHTIKLAIKKYMTDTCDDLSGLDFKLHDFGARGATCAEQAMIGGSAHLVNFKGTDTALALQHIKQYYDDALAGFSIPASAHVTMTAWWPRQEEMAYENMLEQFGQPGKIFACVSDSYDLDNAITNIWCSEKMLEKVKASGATVVIRPDSGDPVTTALRTIQLLDKGAGSTINSKGYKVLNVYRVIYGDGMNLNTIIETLELLKQHSYSADNIAFGCGGALLQQVNRDTFGFAMKNSAIAFDNSSVWHGTSKTPVGAPDKASIEGKVSTFIMPHVGLKTMTVVEVLQYVERNNCAVHDALQVVYAGGRLHNQTSMSEIRQLVSN
jgi:nicotinamide phosphoribosyltransferase